MKAMQFCHGRIPLKLSIISRTKGEDLYTGLVEFFACLKKSASLALSHHLIFTAFLPFFRRDFGAPF